MGIRAKKSVGLGWAGLGWAGWLPVVNSILVKALSLSLSLSLLGSGGAWVARPGPFPRARVRRNGAPGHVWEANHEGTPRK